MLRSALLMSSITVHNKGILILIQKQLLKIIYVPRTVLDTKGTGRGTPPPCPAQEGAALRAG